MVSKFPRICLVVASVMVACDEPDPADRCARWPTDRRYTDDEEPNGRGLWDEPGDGWGQGRELNGRYANGVSVNGIDFRFRPKQGIGLQGVQLIGTALVGIDADGREIRGQDWIGATVPGITAEGETIELEITTVEVDPEREDLTYFGLALDGRNICGDRGRGLFVPGVWNDRGDRLEAAPGHTDFDASFSCTTGVIAKCVMWGYAPDRVGADAHQTCTRMARADYCGDGVPYTQDGTRIDVFDDLGVAQSENGDVPLVFEAGWGPDGAVCVNKTRYAMEVVDEGEWLPPCWDSKPRCASLDEAHSYGAAIVNRSAEQSWLLCEAPQ